MSGYTKVFARAQKNLGPAGVTVPVIDDAMLSCKPSLSCKPAALPPELDCRTYVEHGSN